MALPLTEVLAERIHRHGPISFEEYLEAALYHSEHGFYASGGRAGRGGDFLTSPEVGPLFGAVMGRALDRWWVELGRPDPYVVVEAGAGIGTLARSILASDPDCESALRYVLVERSAVLRAAQAEHLALEPASDAFAVAAASDDGLDDGAPPSGIGPVVVSLAELPTVRVDGVVLANELLDNLAFTLLERREASWAEVRVGVDQAGGLREVVMAASDEAGDAADRLAPDAPDGARIPLQRAAAAWLRDAVAVVERGRIVVIDYAADTSALASQPWHTWLRTYRGHGRGGHPLDAPGTQDITSEVALDQLARVLAPSEQRPQHEFLAEHGLAELVAEGRTDWRRRAALADLAAMRSLSRIREADALTDPSGLGSFTVCEWQLG